jgi:ParB-like chromosome segregation protein Spo0J
MTTLYTEKTLPITQLLLDPNNFRFQDETDFVRADPKRFAEVSVQERATKRIRGEGLAELKNSIISNGFLAVERLVVRSYVKRQGEPELFLVLEGNRRLAALQWIKQDHEAGADVPADVLAVLDAVPVIVIESDDDEGTYLALMGIRHVGGIKQWGGYQRAKLVAELRDLHHYDTTEVADRLGMTKHEVNRRYRALKALQQMQDDEEFADYASTTMYPLFHEAVSLPAVRSWLGWNDSETRFQDEEQLHQFYSLITPPENADEDEGGESRGTPKITTYSQVRELRTILPNRDAKHFLLNPDHTFSEALAIAKAEELSKTWKSQVAEAIGALSSMSVLDLENLDDDGKMVISRVRDVADRLLATYEKLVAE